MESKRTEWEPLGWEPLGPRQFSAKRSQLRRPERGGIVTLHVRAYKAVIVRRGDDGKVEYDSCFHQHQKPGAARKCAEREARRRNREEN